MTFREIFKEEGLYVADSFMQGVAIKIQTDMISGDNELHIVKYKSTSPNRFIESPLKAPIYEGMFDKEYRKIDSIEELFKNH